MAKQEVSKTEAEEIVQKMKIPLSQDPIPLGVINGYNMLILAIKNGVYLGQKLPLTPLAELSNIAITPKDIVDACSETLEKGLPDPLSVRPTYVQIANIALTCGLIDGTMMSTNQIADRYHVTPKHIESSIPRAIDSLRRGFLVKRHRSR